MANFSPLMAEIGLPVWGTPANFNRFSVLASLLQRRRSPQANDILHDLWPSPGLVHCVYIFGAFAPVGIWPRVKIHFASSSERQPNFVAWYTRNGIAELSQRAPRHLYWAGRPSRWASAHILVVTVRAGIRRTGTFFMLQVNYVKINLRQCYEYGTLCFQRKHCFSLLLVGVNLTFRAKRRI